MYNIIGTAKYSDNNMIIYQASKQYTEFHSPRPRKSGNNTSMLFPFTVTNIMCELNLVECLVCVIFEYSFKIGLNIFLHP